MSRYQYGLHRVAKVTGHHKVGNVKHAVTTTLDKIRIMSAREDHLKVPANCASNCAEG